MKDEVVLKSSKIKKRKKIVRIIKICLLIFLLLLLLLYISIGIIYTGGNFSITIDKNMYLQNKIIIYDNDNYKVFRTELLAPTIDRFDNISAKWLPEDIANNEGGSHNGDNYVAYTFYIENMGDITTDYWSEVVIDNVLKNLDEAIRIRVYENDKYITYAKLGMNGNPEKNTTPFLEDDDVIAREHIENFKPGDRNKYTIVIWLEGTDPECTDNILGGEIKIHMAFNSEIVEK